MDSGLCPKCDQYKHCTSLCPEAELYVNQDAGEFHKPGEIHFTQIEKEILRRLAKGQTRQQIKQHLEISSTNLRSHLYKLRKKCHLIVP